MGPLPGSARRGRVKIPAICRFGSRQPPDRTDGERVEYSIDWGSEFLTSLRWIAIMFSYSMIGLLVAGFVLSRTTLWGRQYWRAAGGFFTGRDTRVSAWVLVVVLMLLMVIGVRLTVVLSYQGRDMFNALQGAAEAISNGDGTALDQAEDMFWNSLWLFGLLATIHVVRTLVELYLGSMFEVRLRQFMTTRVTTDWLTGLAFYRNRFVNTGIDGDDAKIQPGVDNPDQRIEIDIDNVSASSRRLVFGSGGSSTNGVIPAIITICTFTKILWELSGPMDIFGTEVPHAMVWMVYLFVLVSTIVAFWLGHPLIRLYFLRERLAANFRYSLVRLRDGAEKVALYRGADTEQRGLLDRFASIVVNFWQVVFRSLKFNGWNFVVNQASAVFPYIIQAPRFFAGEIKLGEMTQTASAFGNVHDSLSFFREAFDSFADLRASLYRLDGLEQANHESRELPQIATVDTERGVEVRKVTTSTPDGVELVSELDLSLHPGDALVIKGRSGSGKTTLLRGLAGLWPFVSGEFARPGESTLFLSQIPYIPLGDLRTAVAYPASPESVGDDSIRAVLEQVFLSHLVGRLDEEADWAAVLSPGEQQRVAFARILLNKPAVAFLDEATSAIDEGLEFELYSLIRRERPDTAATAAPPTSTTPSCSN